MRAKRCFFTLLFLFFFLALSAPVSAAPKAVFSETGFNFGLVAERRDNTHEFIIENSGDQDLIIERIGTDCGCTTTKFDRVIPAGGQGSVFVNLNTNGYRGHNVSRTIKIYTNDPEANPVVLKISAQVDDIVKIDPPRISLSGHANEDLSQTVTITPTDDFPFKVVSTEARFGSNISYELKEEVKDGKTIYYLDVHNTKDTMGRYFDEIVLKTDNPEVSSISVRINCSVLSGGN